MPAHKLSLCSCQGLFGGVGGGRGHFRRGGHLLVVTVHADTSCLSGGRVREARKTSFRSYFKPHVHPQILGPKWPKGVHRQRS